MNISLKLVLHRKQNRHLAYSIQQENYQIATSGGVSSLVKLSGSKAESYVKSWFELQRAG